MTQFDLSHYKKTSDIISLKHLFDSGSQECNVILRVKEGFNLDFVKIRSFIVGDIVTAHLLTEDLIKLEQSPDVISYNVSKRLPLV